MTLNSATSAVQTGKNLPLPASTTIVMRPQLTVSPAQNGPYVFRWVPSTISVKAPQPTNSVAPAPVLGINNMRIICQVAQPTSHRRQVQPRQQHQAQLERQSPSTCQDRELHPELQSPSISWECPIATNKKNERNVTLGLLGNITREQAAPAHCSRVYSIPNSSTSNTKVELAGMDPALRLP